MKKTVFLLACIFLSAALLSAQAPAGTMTGGSDRPSGSVSGKIFTAGGAVATAGAVFLFMKDMPAEAASLYGPYLGETRTRRYRGWFRAGGAVLSAGAGLFVAGTGVYLSRYAAGTAFEPGVQLHNVLCAAGFACVVAGGATIVASDYTYSRAGKKAAGSLSVAGSPAGISLTYRF